MICYRQFYSMILSLPAFLFFQLKSFLSQRLAEMRSEETSSLQHQVQAVAPFVLQQYTSDAIEMMLSGVSLAISALAERRTRDLIMILNSKRSQLLFFSIYSTLCFYLCSSVLFSKPQIPRQTGVHAGGQEAPRSQTETELERSVCQAHGTPECAVLVLAKTGKFAG